MYPRQTLSGSFNVQLPTIYHHYTITYYIAIHDRCTLSTRSYVELLYSTFSSRCVREPLTCRCTDCCSGHGFELCSFKGSSGEGHGQFKHRKGTLWKSIRGKTHVGSVIFINRQKCICMCDSVMTGLE